jgi:uracil-DNA glycosylase family 4
MTSQNAKPSFTSREANSLNPDHALADLEAEIIACRLCPRLVAWREQVARERRRAYRDQEYWGKPVPGFGDPQASLLVVGLAPGAHGSNRTGRMFTGDASGDFLYPALHRAGFASQPRSDFLNDDLRLSELFISAACRCAPPGNKPLPAEIEACRPFLESEIKLFTHLQGFVALGRIAFDWLLGWYGRKGVPTAGLVFAHNAFYTPSPEHPWLLASYHPSRQNTQTGKLTKEMFDAVWNRAKTLLR